MDPRTEQPPPTWAAVLAELDTPDAQLAHIAGAFAFSSYVADTYSTFAPRYLILLPFIGVLFLTLAIAQLPS